MSTLTYEPAWPETADIETSSDDYARRFSGKVGAWFLKVQEDATLQLLAEYPNASILDVGGGHGQVTGALLAQGHRVTIFGSDESCKQRVLSYLDGQRCTFEVGNILDLPYPDRAFDVVLSYRLLPHVTRWEPFLAELARVAGKAILLDYPEVRSVNYIAPHLFRFKKRLEGNTRPFTCFREPELLQVFDRLGFRRSGRYAEFFLPMVLHRKLKSPGISAAMEKIARSVGLTDRFGSPVILKLAQKGESP